MNIRCPDDDHRMLRSLALGSRAYSETRAITDRPKRVPNGALDGRNPITFRLVNANQTIWNDSGGKRYRTPKAER